VSKLPIPPVPPGGVRHPASIALIQAEARRRGVDPAAVLTSAFQRTRPANKAAHKEANYGIYLKHGDNWFANATALESRGGKPVHYSTPAAGLATEERVLTKEELDIRKDNIAKARRFYTAHKGDLNAMARAGATGEVFDLAEEMVKSGEAHVIGAHRNQRHAAGMDFEHDLKNMNLPPNTPFITERYGAGDSEQIVINTVKDGNPVQVSVDLFFKTRFHPDLGRRMTAAEVKAAKNDRYQRSGLSLNKTLSKKLGFDVWDIVQ